VARGGQDGGRLPHLDQAAGGLGLQQVDDDAARDARDRRDRRLQPVDPDGGIAGRSVLVEDEVGDVGELPS
jgi:hypothetical protein